ncbi:hypothetical protein [Mesorhizobium captivum]|uniref:hypothetical protein n=1 Tax=Mesorhizobium captivum TaxID=3072319 RepID=UPI002A241E8D|nr:hypothetical protein [Mesorhizobium sp. VK23E]MDX8512588.1 hypothetical protein [Mesorhizobium sp. VK23E]
MSHNAKWLMKRDENHVKISAAYGAFARSMAEARGVENGFRRRALGLCFDALSLSQNRCTLLGDMHWLDGAGAKGKVGSKAASSQVSPSLGQVSPRSFRFRRTPSLPQAPAVGLGASSGSFAISLAIPNNQPPVDCSYRRQY